MIEFVLDYGILSNLFPTDDHSEDEGSEVIIDFNAGLLGELFVAKVQEVSDDTCRIRLGVGDIEDAVSQLDLHF